VRTYRTIVESKSELTLVPAGRDDSVRRSFLQGTLLEVAELERLVLGSVATFESIESSGSGEDRGKGSGSEEGCEGERAHVVEMKVVEVVRGIDGVGEGGIGKGWVTSDEGWVV